MARTKGAKTLTPKDIENIKALIRPRLKYRDTMEQLLEVCEDGGYPIGINKLIEIRKEMRNDFKKVFEERPEEMVEEHDLAIQLMKELLKKLQDTMGNVDPEDIPRVSAEIRAIQRDLIDYYGSEEIVEGVFNYFEEKKKEEKMKKKDKVKEELEE